MASVFLRGRSDIYLCAFKTWDAAKQSWTWVQKTTGQTDRNKAAAVLATYERAAGMAKAGTLTRARALDIVNDILRMAGQETVAAAPSLLSHIRAMHDAKKVSAGSERKLGGWLNALRSWAGDKINLPVDAWTAEDLASYYAHLRSELSDTTANDHLGWLRGVFTRAVALGHRDDNPAMVVQQVTNDSVDKEVITQAHQVLVLRQMRREGARAWAMLAALGWHTGHRLQDLLDVTGERLEHVRGIGWAVRLEPRKKRGQGIEKKGRAVVLPIPGWLARGIRRLGGFASINGADNRNGRVSEAFVSWLQRAGVDTLPTARKKRTVNLISFHSYRHALTTRLINAGVPDKVAMLVTDHDSADVQRGYTHREIDTIASALKSARLSGRALARERAQ
jgi:integrase